MYMYMYIYIYIYIRTSPCISPRKFARCIHAWPRHRFGPVACARLWNLSGLTVL